ncbi:MAG: acetate/propionate family kinase [Pleurocapsa sp.]
MNILVLNAGSSSQKSALYQLTSELPIAAPEPIWSANIDWTVQTGKGILKAKTSQIEQKTTLETNDKSKAIALMLDTLVTGETAVITKLSQIDLVGHRVVHGGAEYDRSTKITPEVKEAIARLIPLAPAHNPAHLEGIEAIENILGTVPQIAVFDTGFHRNLPPEAAIYPIPYQWYERGIRRYGFHGISHQYCSDRAAQILNIPKKSSRIIVCHLGNGCSLSAVKNGVSIDTTMGFTPLEGLMMGTRSGSIDPAILIYLMREHGFDAASLDTMLNKESGLKGVSGVSADVREINKAIASGNKRARLALDIYIQRLKKAIGAMLPLLGGLDILVFTAGIGENSSVIRAETCKAFEFMGLKLDLIQNDNNITEQNIALPDSQVKIIVIHTNEDWAIARESWQYYEKN